MTVQTFVMAESEKFLLGSNHWLKASNTVPNGNKKVVVCLDVLTTFYGRTANGEHGKFVTRTLEEFYTVICEKIYYYLGQHNVIGVHFLVDTSAPENKQILQKRQSENTPETPLHLVEDFEGNRKEKGIEAWRRWMWSRIKRIPRDQRRHCDPLSISAREDFDLPIDPCNEIPEPQKPYYSHLLSNKDFKNYLIQAVMGGVKRKLEFPPQNPKFDAQWVVIQGPGFSCVRHPDKWTELAKDLHIDYTEADTAMGFITNHYAQHDIDVVIESSDGDCLQSCLFATHERVKCSNERVDSVDFTNKVFFVQCRWTQHQTKIFDVNMMWQSIHLTFCGIASRGLDIGNPVGTYLALCFLTQNDYVRSFPGVGSKTYFQKFFKYVDNIFALGPLVGNHWALPSKFSVNWKTFQRLAVAMYCRSEADFRNPDTFLASLNRKNFSVPFLRVTFANLVWCLRYFNSTLYQFPVPDPFEIVKGKSLYGYVKNNTGKDSVGSADVDFAEDVDVWQLHEE